jgi:hypothetical protein
VVLKAALFCLLLLGEAIVIGTDGKNADQWNGSSVIYAVVKAVTKDKHGMYTVQLEPLATLTGRFDPAYDGEIAPHVQIDGPLAIDGSTIEHVPEKGTKVLAFVGNDIHPKNYTPTILNGSVTFMPGGRGLAEVTGFDDPKVTETIENLRKLRGKQREETEQKAAAEKKGK